MPRNHTKNYSQVERPLQEEVEWIIRKVIATHACLQPANPNFGNFNDADAVEIVTDLIREIKKSYWIHDAHHKYDWGK